MLKNNVRFFLAILQKDKKFLNHNTSMKSTEIDLDLGIILLCDFSKNLSLINEMEQIEFSTGIKYDLRYYF